MQQDERVRDATSRGSVPILMYHQVTPKPDRKFLKYAVKPDRFAQQMRWLALTGHHAISMDALLAHRAGAGTLPTRPVVVTFDDGYQDTYDHAVPVLLEHGFTAIFYLVGQEVGHRSRWLEAERGLSLALFDWPTARRLEMDGFRCGSHALTHARLATLDGRESDRELMTSRKLLEDNLGREVRDLAYPHGSYDDRVIRQARAAGYRSACSVRIGRSPRLDDVMALHRIPVGGQESLATFIFRLRAGLSPREWLRARRGGARARVRADRAPGAR